ncbi:MAG: hypothetical protein ABIL22_04245 [candidate division WOR-3 bacterium]
MENAGLTFEEKAKQIDSVQEKANDVNVIFPEGVPFELAGRQYKVFPLKLKQMRLLLKLSKIKYDSSMTDGDLDVIVDAISEVLNEGDRDFIERNIDAGKLSELFGVLEKVNYSGIPKGKNTKGE